MRIQTIVAALACCLGLAAQAQTLITPGNSPALVLDDSVALIAAVHAPDGASFADVFNFSVSLPALVVGAVFPQDVLGAGAPPAPTLQALLLVDTDLNVLAADVDTSDGLRLLGVAPSAGQYGLVVVGQALADGGSQLYVGVAAAQLWPDLLPIPGTPLASGLVPEPASGLVPEPAGAMLLASGLALLALALRRRGAAGLVLAALATAGAQAATPAPAACSAAAAAPALQPGDWPMYGRDAARSFANADSCLRPDNVRKLVARWFFRDPEDPDAFTAQAVVANGVVYIGGWNGYFYAIDQATGALRWRFSADCQNAVIPVPKKCLAPGQTPPPGRAASDGGLITAAAAVVGDTVYFGGGRTLYALDTADGALRWKRVICGNPDDPNCASDAQDKLRIMASPAVANGLVYVGVTADGQAGYRGAMLAIDAATGAQRWRFEVDPVLDANGQPVLGADGLPAAGRNRGCGNVWGSPTVDAVNALVMFGTADCEEFDQLPYHDAVLALDGNSGRLRWAYTPLPGQGSACDLDFGATGNLIDLAGGHYYGIGNKNGTYYVLDRLTGNPAGRLAWATNVVYGGDGGGFFGAAAFDGTRVIGATAVGDFRICNPANPRDTSSQEPSLHAFGAAAGNVLWQDKLARSYAATTAGDGVVFVTTSDFGSPFGPTLQTVNSATGVRVRFDLLPFNTVAPVTPVRGMLIVPVGDYPSGTQGGVVGLALPSLPANCQPVVTAATPCR